MRAYGRALRGDWADFDGRTARDALNDLADALASDEPTTYEALCREVGICHVVQMWPDFCPESDGWSCPHMDGDW